MKLIKKTLKEIILQYSLYVLILNLNIIYHNLIIKKTN